MRRLGAIIFVCLAIGCTTPRAGTPLAQNVRADDSLGRLKYQRQIVERRICSNDDAFHLLIQYTNGQDPCGDYTQRVSWLKSRQMLPDGFDRPADEAITRGTLAVGIARVLNIHGGIVMRILPRSERYVTRELVYRGVYPPGSSPQQTYSGLEVIGVLAKMEDLQTGDPANLPASKIGEPEAQQ
jgi:hypothetical protein